MELTILGTAAAEAWPAPFCRCDACQTARRRGGPNHRTRSGALLDNDFKIDFGPDTTLQMLRSGRDLLDVRTIVFTHAHSDHLTVAELEWATPGFSRTPPEHPIAVYGNPEVMGMIGAQFPEPEKNKLSLQPPLEPLKPVTMVAGDTILPLPADHAPGALLLRITRGEKTFFYGHDSGLYPEATLDALGAGPKLDLALFDCTYGGGDQYNNRGHMGITGVVRMAEELRRRGAVTDRTKLVATHFSHNGLLSHEALVEAFLPHGIAVAYDGIVIEI